MATTQSEFKSVFNDPHWSKKFHQFLEVIFHLYPEDKFHQLLLKTSMNLPDDEAIYKEVQAKLPGIKPFLSAFTLALPALLKQKKEMSSQVLQLLGSKTAINGYLEIGSTCRYISELKKHIQLKGILYVSNDIAPNNSIADMFERGQVTKFGTFIDLNNYAAIRPQQIPDESIDLVTCHIGLHHCPHTLLEGYIQSIHRILRKDGLFILRDHDVKTDEMATFVSLVHTVFNLGLNVPWETNHAEFKSFKTIDTWSEIIGRYGFKDQGQRILQNRDPSDNTLIAFVKQSL